MTPTVIVLAAGTGSRFRAHGGTSGKLQALLAGRPVLEHVLQAVRDSGLPWHVVTQEATASLSPQGMGTSIASGVAATAQSTGWLILPGDLPLIQAHSLRAVALALATHAVVVPTVLLRPPRDSRCSMATVGGMPQTASTSGRPAGCTMERA